MSKYPVKYAILELKEKSGYSYSYRESTYGFITSKCYVIEKSTRYYCTGNEKTYYKVVFPYKDIMEYRKNLRYDYNTKAIGNEIIPRPGFNENDYTISYVDEIFDNYEETNALAQNKNEELKTRIIAKIPTSLANYKTKLENEELLFSLRMTICQRFEKIASVKTAHMHITPDSTKTYDKTKELIKFKNNKE